MPWAPRHFARQHLAERQFGRIYLCEIAFCKTTPFQMSLYQMMLNWRTVFRMTFSRMTFAECHFSERHWKIVTWQNYIFQNDTWQNANVENKALQNDIWHHFAEWHCKMTEQHFLLALGKMTSWKITETLQSDFRQNDSQYYVIPWFIYSTSIVILGIILPSNYTHTQIIQSLTENLRVYQQLIYFTLFAFILFSK
jgi:hypothetical protein